LEHQKELQLMKNTDWIAYDEVVLVSIQNQCSSLTAIPFDVPSRGRRGLFIIAVNNNSQPVSDQYIDNPK
jgi:hypothetical protein